MYITWFCNSFLTLPFQRILLKKHSSSIFLQYEFINLISSCKVKILQLSYFWELPFSFPFSQRERDGHAFLSFEKGKKKKKERWSIPFVPNRKGGVSTRAQDWREMLLTISTGLNKVGNFIRFSSVPPSMVKIKEGWIDKGTRGLARVR